MALYFVTYDLSDSGDCQLLADELKNFNAIKVLDSTWCIEHNNTDIQNLIDHFRNFIDPNDALTVSRSLDLV